MFRCSEPSKDFNSSTRLTQTQSHFSTAWNFSNQNVTANLTMILITLKKVMSLDHKMSSGGRKEIDTAWGSQNQEFSRLTNFMLGKQVHPLVRPQRDRGEKAIGHRQNKHELGIALV